MTTAMVMAAIAETSCISGALHPSSRLISKPFYVGGGAGGGDFFLLHLFTNGEIETSNGHMPYLRLRNRTYVQT